MKVDFNNMKDEEVAPIEPDDYLLLLKEVSERKTTTGKQMYGIQFRITGHPVFEGRNVLDNFALTPTALWRWRQFLEAKHGLSVI